MNAAEFVSKWRKAGSLAERPSPSSTSTTSATCSASPSRPRPTPTGRSFTFEKGAQEARRRRRASPTSGCKGRFAWEYKKKHADLDAAFDQLRQYVEALENPPAAGRLRHRADRHQDPLQRLPDDRPRDPPRRPGASPGTRPPPRRLPRARAAQAREDHRADHRAGAPRSSAESPSGPRSASDDPTAVAHFLDRLIFCMFAEDVGLLPEQVFSRGLREHRPRPRRIVNDVGRACSRRWPRAATSGARRSPTSTAASSTTRAGPGPDGRGDRGHPAGRPARLEPDGRLHLRHPVRAGHGPGPAAAARGPLHRLRATSSTLVEPVVMEPLRREWARRPADRARSAPLATGAGRTPPTRAAEPARRPRPRRQAAVDASSTGSGRSACSTRPAARATSSTSPCSCSRTWRRRSMTFCRAPRPARRPARGRPAQLYGIEINPYAHDLAQMTVWIGYLQWIATTASRSTRRPDPRAARQPSSRKDAILDLSDPDHPGSPTGPRPTSSSATRRSLAAS